MTHGDAVGRHLERVSDELSQLRRQRAAAYEHDGLRRIAVELYDLLHDGFGQLLDARHDRLENLLGRELAGRAEDIGEFHRLAFGCLALDALSHIEIEQEMLRDRLGDLITGQRHHAIGYDGAIARDGHVRGAGADIDEHEVQMTHRDRYQDIDGRDRLEGQCAHLETGSMQGRLHGVDDLTRQECRYDDGLRLLPALADEHAQVIVIEDIAYGAVAHAVVARRVINRMRADQLRLRGLYAGEIEVALLLGRDDAIHIHLGLSRHRVQRTAGRGNSRVMQTPDLLLEHLAHRRYDGRHLRHVMDLAVEHSPRLMLEAVRGYDLQLAIRLALGYDADDGAGADIQREYPLLGLPRRRGGFLAAGALTAGRAPLGLADRLLSGSWRWCGAARRSIAAELAGFICYYRHRENLLTKINIQKGIFYLFRELYRKVLFARQKSSRNE